MITTITKDGLLKITAENDLEEYALRHWRSEAFVGISDLMRGEDYYLRGSKILISRLEKQ